MNVVDYNIINSIQSLLNELVSPRLQEKVFVIKLVFLALTILFSVIIIYFCLHTKYLQIRYGERLDDIKAFHDYGRNRDTKKWLSIKNRIKTNSPEGYKLAVIEAVGFLDSILQRLGYGKETLEERFQLLIDKNISTAPQLNSSLKLYKDIIRDPDFKISKAEAVEVVNAIGQVLSELEII